MRSFLNSKNNASQKISGSVPTNLRHFSQYFDPGNGVKRFSRKDRSILARWRAEIDWMLVGLTILLSIIGLLAINASDAEYKLDQLARLSLGLIIMLFVSMLPLDLIRRFSIIGMFFGLFALLLLVVSDASIWRSGSTRWLDLGFIGIQPVEFFKPFYAVTIAWLLSIKQKYPDLPIISLTIMINIVVVTLLMMQPDFGQSFVIISTWLIMLFVTGIKLRVVAFFTAVGCGLVMLAYQFYNEARERIDGFLQGFGDYSQTQIALDALQSGGWTGKGPGAGEIKVGLPDSHTDFIFSVIGEEFGLALCLFIIVTYFLFFARVAYKVIGHENQFVTLATLGVMIPIIMQAIINIGMNLQLLPPKGITLPLISYGGSSVIAITMGIGIILVLTRRNPYLQE